MGLARVRRRRTASPRGFRHNPISKQTAWVAGAACAVGLTIGVTAYLLGNKQADAATPPKRMPPEPAPTPQPPAPTPQPIPVSPPLPVTVKQWLPVVGGHFIPGDSYRMSVPLQAAFNDRTLVANGFTALGFENVTVWLPTDLPLPGDWDAADFNTPGRVRVQMTAGQQAAQLTVNSPSVPPGTLFWVAQ